MSDLQELTKELMRDKEFSSEYEALQPEMDITRAMIEARIQAGLTQTELSHKSGISQADISRLENGTRNPSLSLLKRLAEAMDTTLKIDLLTAKSGLSQQLALGGEGNIFFGALTENYAAQQLTAAGLPLYYWENSGTAELDFLLQSGGAVIGAEVKVGEHTRSRSLNRFLQEYRPPYAIRWSTRNIGEQGQVLSLPLYAIFCLPAILI